MEVKERDQYEQFDWFGSGDELLEGPSECSIEPPGSKCHGVIYLDLLNTLASLLQAWL